MEINYDKELLAAELKGSFLQFCRYFFKHLTQRDFIISNPLGRESHHITLARMLTALTRQEVPSQRLLIAIPPGHGKSIFCSMWCAWNMAMYPDCNFLYVSYSHELATKHTSFIKQIMTSSHYKYLFDVALNPDSRAKDSFKTTVGGSISAHGSSGSITGFDGGLPGLDRFSGAVIIDDPIKPIEAHSDTIRASVIRNYEETIRQRPRGHNVPIVFIGQRLHEDDLAAFLLRGDDTRPWDSVVLKSIDENNHALYPEAFPLADLLSLQQKSPYVFASQMQQDPMPAGGGLFKKDWFVLLDEEPEIICTFITVDSAETDKTYNDATAFGFFGIYEIESMGRKTGEYGLHWLDAAELFIEPKDLKGAFLDFWQDCMRHSVAPLIAAIEKKSTGVTLISALNEVRGIQIRNIERSRASGSKTQRFIDIQPHIASKHLSLPRHATHTNMCIEHMIKITANDTHRRDDLADTVADAIKIALIDKTLIYNNKQDGIKAATIMTNQKNLTRMRGIVYGGQ